ncbi:hypothetical protein H0H93_016002 [Arthromyces matolae]|nr:hypothetical protein H0H93_016002 [Arthromyces matolae]
MALEIIAGAATIGSFLTSVIGLSQGIKPNDRTAKIRDPLNRAKDNLHDTLTRLESFRDVMEDEYGKFLIRCQDLNDDIDESLAETVDDISVSSLKKRWVYDNKKRAARQIENESLELKSIVKISTMEAAKRAAESPKQKLKNYNKAKIENMKMRLEHEELKTQLRSRMISVESLATTITVVGA